MGDIFVISVMGEKISHLIIQPIVEGSNDVPIEQQALVHIQFRVG